LMTGPGLSGAISISTLAARTSREAVMTPAPAQAADFRKTRRRI
jgi:hypothetical protein